MHGAHLSYHTPGAQHKDAQSTRTVKVSNLITRNTCTPLPKWTFGWSFSTWTKGQKNRNPVPLGIAPPSENSKLYKTTPLKLHELQYHMYHQVHRKNEGSLEKLSCSTAQKVENFHKDVPGFNFVLQMTVSCSEVKLHGFVVMKILQQLYIFQVSKVEM